MHSLRQWGSLCAENKSTHEWRTEMSLLNFVLGLGLGKETAESRAGGGHGQVEVGTDEDRAEAELGFSQDLEWVGMGWESYPTLLFSSPLPSPSPARLPIQSPSLPFFTIPHLPSPLKC